MFCPQCGANQSDEVKFCKSCGANLSAVRQAVATGAAGEGFDWSKTWVTEMFLSGQEQLKRKLEIERLQGITPEVKRYNEVKGGVITACVGVGLALFLYVIAEGLILGGHTSPRDAELMRRVWVIGAIPFMVGLALIINGLVVSKRQAEAARRERQEAAEAGSPAARPGLRPADTTEFIPADFSVTESTTKHLNVPAAKHQTKEVMSNE